MVALFTEYLQKFAAKGPAYTPCLKAIESWEKLALNNDRLTRLLRAVRAAFKSHPEPENLQWWLIRELSHLRGPDDTEEDQGGCRCKKCGGPTKPGPKAAFMARYPQGLELNSLQDLLDYDRFLGLHLTEEDLSRLAGKVINCKRQRDIVFKYYVEDEREKRRSHKKKRT